MSQPTGEQRLEPSDDLASDGLEFIDLDTVARQPPFHRKRVVQFALVVVILVVAVATLWRITPSLGGQSIGPTPTPPMIEATLLSNVNFGTMLVNGAALAGQLPLTTMLPSQGTTVITLNAPPFRPQSCAFTDLLAPQDDPVHCLLIYPGDSAPSEPQASPSPDRFTFGVFLTPDDLPPDQQSKVLAVMSQPLSVPEQTTVPSGDYYAANITPDGIVISSQRATTPLLARASFEPGKTAGPITGPTCGGQGICPWGSPPPGLVNQSWSLLFTEALRWQFIDANGVTLADVSIPSMNIVGLVLSYDAVIGWQVRKVTAILGSVQGTVCQAGIAALWFKIGGGNLPAPLHNQGVEGCELGLTINGVDGGRYVWRFGVLLAADAQAHGISPNLPIASPAEIAAVGG